MSIIDTVMHCKHQSWTHVIQDAQLKSILGSYWYVHRSAEKVSFCCLTRNMSVYISQSCGAFCSDLSIRLCFLQWNGMSFRARHNKILCHHEIVVNDLELLEKAIFKQQKRGSQVHTSLTLKCRVTNCGERERERERERETNRQTHRHTDRQTCRQRKDNTQLSRRTECNFFLDPRQHVRLQMIPELNMLCSVKNGRSLSPTPACACRCVTPVLKKFHVASRWKRQCLKMTLASSFPKHSNWFSLVPYLHGRVDACACTTRLGTSFVDICCLTASPALCASKT